MMIIDVLYNVSVIRFLFNLYLPSGNEVITNLEAGYKTRQAKKTI